MGPGTGSFTTQTAEHLRSFAGRALAPLGSMEAAKAELKGIIKEAKDAGFDTKLMRKAIKELQAGEAAETERQNLETYKVALGPLFDHADQRAAA